MPLVDREDGQALLPREICNISCHKSRSICQVRYKMPLHLFLTSEGNNNGANRASKRSRSRPMCNCGLSSGPEYVLGVIYTFVSGRL